MFRKNKINSPSRDSSPTAPAPQQSLLSRSSSTGRAVNTPVNLPNITNTTTLRTPATIVSDRDNKFNPRLIFSQIVALQSIHYLVLSFLFQLNYILFSSTVTIDRIFTAKYLNLWTKSGQIDVGTIVVSSFVGAFMLAIIVEKSKKCLDFSVTLFFLHFILSCLYDGFSVLQSWDFWIVHIFSMIVMVLLGEFLCSRRELMDIPLL